MRTKIEYWFFVLILCLLSAKSFGQYTPSITGPSCVAASVQYAYTLEITTSSQTLYNGTFNYSVSGGTVVGGTTSGTVTGRIKTLQIKWNATSGGSISLTSPIGNAYFNTVAAPTLSSGTIYGGASQTINYNAVPGNISCYPASGGACSPAYSYLWMSSTDGTNYSGTGVSALIMTFSTGLTQTTYYKLKTTETSSGAIVYSGVATVNVYPQVKATTMNLPSQSINAWSNASTLTVSGISGGNGSYTYQWESSPDASTWGAISGAASSSFTPTALTISTYYRLKVTSNGVTAISPTAYVQVYPVPQAGATIPASEVVTYGGAATPLTMSAASGGNGIYTYQWWSSVDNINWNPIPGATSITFTPSSTISTYYIGQVTSNGVATNSNTVKVNVTVVSGNISPSSQTVNYNTNGAMLSVSPGGGTGIYSYQWQRSLDNSTWSNLSGENNATITPAALKLTCFYRVSVSSDGFNALSGSAVINVTPPLTAGAVMPEFVTIASGNSPGNITSVAASGGSCGSYLYQWQSSVDGVTWNDISGATSVNLVGSALTGSMMYRLRIICGTDTVFSNLATITVGTPVTNLNYVRERDITKPGVTDTVTANGLTNIFDAQQVTTFQDGLGRGIQTVTKQGSPQQKDVVELYAYDQFGRQAVDYLPYISPSATGLYKSNALAEHAAFNGTVYPNEQAYYSRIQFEPSPLNTPIAALAPGSSWLSSNRMSSVTNLIATSADSVCIWQISAQTGSRPVWLGFFSTGRLFKKISVNETGQQTVEYSDQQGRTILRKIQLSNTPSTGPSGWLNTYYVSDDKDNVRFILPPKAVEWLMGNNWNLGTVTGDTICNELCFRYEFDYRGRTIVKKTPGAGEVRFVYDMRDRLVMSQDSVLRTLHKWHFNRYDALNRLDSSGLILDPANYNDQVYHQSLADASLFYPNLASYTYEVQTAIFYDNYDWVSGTGSGLSSSLAAVASANLITTYNVSPIYAQPVVSYPITRGLTTGTMTKIIDKSSNLYNANFYDDRGRIIQVQSTNYTGGVDTVTTQYDFNGKPLRIALNHKKIGNGAQNHTVSTKMNYDNAGRLKSVFHNIDGAPADQLIDSLQYDELGRVHAKYLGNNIDSLVYDFNIRGWLTSINKSYVAGGTNHFFGLELGYDKTGSVAAGNSYAPNFNGNISGVVWKTAGAAINRKYDYVYDNANRLLSANFGQYNGSGFDNSAGIDFSVSGLSYDANGNIKAMSQKGFTVGGSTFVDQLNYNYASNSNKLLGVTDGANNPNSLLGDFHYNTSTKQATDYSYDGNGNMKLDRNKTIDTIAYNYLNLPQLVHMNGKGNITYVFSAVGEKLAKIVSDSLSRHITTTTYIHDFTYQRTDTITSPNVAPDTLQFVSSGEGRARWSYHKYTSGTAAYKFEYDFMERDHLGNVRTVLTQQRDTSNYLASMEAAYRNTENSVFANIANTAYPRSGVAGYPTDVSVTNPNDSVSRVNFNGVSGQKIGPSLLIKVMSGDSVKIGVKSYYNTGSGATNNSSFTDVLNSLAGGLVGMTGGSHGTLSSLTSSGSAPYLGLTSFLLANESVTSGYPKAYLNWIFLDNQFNYVSALSGAVPASGASKPAGQLNIVAPGSDLIINRSGYLYVWVSNETQGWDVFFDNLSVQHRQGPFVEENHYYPFGLAMAGISDKALKGAYKENKDRFNGGTELSSGEFADGAGLEFYETPYRTYDPQLGIFHQIDPLSDLLVDQSPYSFALNNPVSYNDILGLAPDSSKVPGADVKPMETVTVTAKKRGCRTCNSPTVSAAAAPSTVAAPIVQPAKVATASVGAVTLTLLGEVGEGAITITGVGSSIILAPFVGMFIIGYDVAHLNLPPPILHVPHSEVQLVQSLKVRDLALNPPKEKVYTYATEPIGEQYTLRADADGDYPVFQFGKGQIGTIKLKRGDIYKIGTTIDADARYSGKELRSIGAGVYYVPEFVGPVTETLVVEYMKLENYKVGHYGRLPPGNTKLR